MIVAGNRPTKDHFSKVSIYNFSGLKKYKKGVYRNDKKKLPLDFWEVSWVGLFPTIKVCLNFAGITSRIVALFCVTLFRVK